ncbi:MAG TPA: addiction module protein [Longimicrobium sp.]|jgi:putative addiction module component (TIGR02574 family)|nr:addiction module protein [Longimicrobium sp.]
MTIDEIEAAALELPDEQIADLMDRLVQHRGVDPEIEASWREEVERWVAESDQAEVTGIPVEESLTKMHRLGVDDLASAAMQMPLDKRAELADQLIASVLGEDRYDPAWAAEMNRRIDEIEAGTAKTLSEEEFFEKLKARRAARPVS